MPVPDIVLCARVRQDHWSNRAPTQGLLNHCINKRQAAPVRCNWKTSSTGQLIDLFLRLALRIRTDHHSEEEGRKSRYSLWENVRVTQYKYIMICNGIVCRGGLSLKVSLSVAWILKFTRRRVRALTVSAPATYRDMADHLLLCSSSAHASPASIRRERNEVCVFPAALWCFTNAYGFSATSLNSDPHLRASCWKPVPGTQLGILLTKVWYRSVR